METLDNRVLDALESLLAESSREFATAEDIAGELGNADVSAVKEALQRLEDAGLVVSGASSGARQQNAWRFARDWTGSGFGAE